MTIVEYIEELFESGDPTVRKWPFVGTYYVPFLMSFLYVLFVKWIGPSLMQNKKPFNLRNLMIVYNLSIVLMYTACLVTLLYFFCTTDAYKYICSTIYVSLDNYTYWASYAAWIIYILKYIEYADTVFFVLRKKNHLITNLHVIHHAALPVIGWVLFRTETSGFQFIPGCINSFIHIVMYSYYGLAAFGPRFQKYLWWKEHLTQMQMLQFVLILFFVLIVIPFSGCKTTKHGLVMDIVFAVLFLALFYNFYKKTYKTRPPKVDQKNGHANNSIANGNLSTFKETQANNGFVCNASTEENPVKGPIRRR